MSAIPLVSVSGGKDSTATLLIALELHGQRVRAAFADTGNEHEATYDYVRFLHQRFGVSIQWLRRDFTEEWWRRRNFIRDKWADKGVPDDVVQRVLAVFEKGPTGNPYLDLCMIKGRFPSRRAQFCTQYLKTEPLTEFALELIDAHGAVESWQGVRAEESEARRWLPSYEYRGGGYGVYRPILRWKVADVFDAHRAWGIAPNPLYKKGMKRVGCMPCINAAKDEILAISKRFPQHIDRIEEWEAAVGLGSKRGESSFFSNPDRDAHLDKRGIRKVVEWSKTKRGGQLMDWIRIQEEPTACASAYGLCE